MRVPDGYSFPLNPKWLLCDEGWWDVFTALQQSEAAKTALDAWFPGDLRERMAAVRAAYPRVFAPQQTASQPVENIEPDKVRRQIRASVCNTPCNYCCVHFGISPHRNLDGRPSGS
eukprot:219513-Prymnesium_polylepis.2